MSEDVVTAQEIAEALYANVVGPDFPIRFADLDRAEHEVWLEQGRDGLDWLRRCRHA